MSMPKRLQRKHYRERVPSGSVGVARPSFFGNEFDGETYGPPEVSVRLFEAKYEHDSAYQTKVRRRLRGKDLWCYCALDAPCHADVLLQRIFRLEMRQLIDSKRQHRKA